MTRAFVKDGEIEFGSPLAKHRFLKLAEGHEIKLDILVKPTSEMRKYFEGCLVPAFYYMHPHSGWKTFADAREVLKLEFSPGVRELTDREGNQVKVAPSTTELPKRRFTTFVEAITDWMRESGVSEAVLDSEEYKRWRDTNFEDPYYPPLQRLKDLYDQARKAKSA